MGRTAASWTTPSSSAPPTLRPTPLSILGDHASEYKLAPDLIEEKDLAFFNFFADGISNPRLKNHYKKACSDSGRQFIAIFIQEMDDDGSSLTAEDTVEARMRAILAGGLAEVLRYVREDCSISNSLCDFPGGQSAMLRAVWR